MANWKGNLRSYRWAWHDGKASWTFLIDSWALEVSERGESRSSLPRRMLNNGVFCSDSQQGAYPVDGPAELVEVSLGLQVISDG